VIEDVYHRWQNRCHLASLINSDAGEDNVVVVQYAINSLAPARDQSPTDVTRSAVFYNFDQVISSRQMSEWRAVYATMTCAAIFEAVRWHS